MIAVSSHTLTSTHSCPPFSHKLQRGPAEAPPTATLAMARHTGMTSDERVSQRWPDTCMSRGGRASESAISSHQRSDTTENIM